jgi:hypothetical protein
MATYLLTVKPLLKTFNKYFVSVVSGFVDRELKYG